MASTLSQLSALEAFRDGPIPAGERDALRFGSVLASDIAQTKQEIVFYRDMLVKVIRAGKAWKARGAEREAEINRQSAWCYLRTWRARRERLVALLEVVEREAA